jgi:hypothetical protein
LKFGAGDEARTSTFSLGSKLSAVYFQYLQNRSAKTYVHATHTVQALPDLRIAAGRLRDGFYHALLFANADLRILFGGTAGMVQTASAVLYIILVNAVSPNQQLHP